MCKIRKYEIIEDYWVLGTYIGQLGNSKKDIPDQWTGYLQEMRQFKAVSKKSQVYKGIGAMEIQARHTYAAHNYNYVGGWTIDRVTQHLYKVDLGDVTCISSINTRITYKFL